MKSTLPVWEADCDVSVALAWIQSGTRRDLEQSVEFFFHSISSVLSRWWVGVPPAQRLPQRSAAAQHHGGVGEHRVGRFPGRGRRHLLHRWAHIAAAVNQARAELKELTLAALLSCELHKRGPENKRLQVVRPFGEVALFVVIGKEELQSSRQI